MDGDKGTKPRPLTLKFCFSCGNQEMLTNIATVVLLDGLVVYWVVPFSKGSSNMVKMCPSFKWLMSQDTQITETKELESVREALQSCYQTTH